MKSPLKIDNFILIACGAIPGAIIRWKFNDIYIVNLIGCFLFAYFYNISFPVRYKTLLLVGFLGSLTTFSGWIFDLFKLISNGLLINFFLNIFITILTSLLAVFWGYLLAKRFS